MTKNDILNLLDSAKAGGASYADIRKVKKQAEDLATKDGVVEAIASSEDEGYGIRVIVDGAWGFAGSNDFSRKAQERTLARAIAIAKASSLAKKYNVRLADCELVPDGHYETPMQEDPFSVPLSEKIDLLLAADKAIRVSDKIRVSQASLNAIREDKIFASTEGSYITQMIMNVGAGVEATAVTETDVQNRTFPKYAGGQFQTGGFELIRKMELIENAPRIGQEAVELLSAEQCPSGIFDVILDSRQISLQIHESAGHATELDRVLGYEASFAGTSFLTVDKLGNFQYGSPQVTIVADATNPTGCGTFGWDDEGVRAQRTVLIDKGRLVDFISNRETAPLIGRQYSNGTDRADGWSRMPLIRMTNISLDPGEWEFDELLADTKDGIFMENNKSWSIDDRRLNFQFGCEIAWQIKDGKLGKMYKNPTYTGITPQFWNSCDAICNEKYWTLWGVPNCGKGQPEQGAHTAHGASPARFRGLQVGVGKW